MKKNVENHDELLKTLVLNGDAHAFFSLTMPYFRERYLRERGTGTPQQDAQHKILAEAVDLLEAVQQVRPKHFDTWFEEHCSLVSDMQQEIDAELLLDKKLFAEIDDFLGVCSSELLRTGSEIKRDTVVNRKKFPRVLFRHKITLPLLVGALVLLTAGGTVFLMTRFHIALQIAVLTADGRSSVQFPPEGWMVTPSGESLSGENIGTDTVHRQDSLPSVLPEVSRTDTPVPQSVAESSGISGTKSVRNPAPQPQRRSLPPVIPKARLILPPPPPPPPAPVGMESGAAESPIAEDVTAPVQQTVVPPAVPVPSETDEPEIP